MIIRDIYINAEYGFGQLNKSFIRNLFSLNNSDSFKEKLKSGNGELLTIYRGVGSKSSETEKAYSWTLNISIAMFFATRFNDKNPVVYEGKVDISDVIDSEIEKEVKSLLEVTNDTVGVIARRIQKTKQRWYDKEMMENEAFSEEIRIAKELYKSLEISNQLKKFKYVYNDFENCTELENSIIKELSEWYKNEDSLLTDFRYLKAKRPYQIKKAFINDALYLSYSFLRDEYPYGEKSVVVGAPDVIGLIPIDHTNRVKINVDNIVKKESKAYFSNKYVVDDDFAVESLMDVDILKKGVMVETLKILGWNDMDIFFILLSKRDDDFFITREIITDVGSIVKEKYSSRSEQNYQSVRESLWRMEFLSTGVITPSLTGFSFRLLDDVEIGTFKKMVQLKIKIE